MKSLARPHAEERSRGERVSKHAAPSFETRTFGALLRIRTENGLTIRIVFVLVLLAIGLATPAQAQPVDFAGKTVTLAIATPSGGGDLYGRMVARHIGRHQPGNPTVVPQGGADLALLAGNERAPVG